jgi:hypothetical protein
MIIPRLVNTNINLVLNKGHVLVPDFELLKLQRRELRFDVSVDVAQVIRLHASLESQMAYLKVTKTFLRMHSSLSPKPANLNSYLTPPGLMDLTVITCFMSL